MLLGTYLTFDIKEKATNKFVRLISHKFDGIIVWQGRRVDEGYQASLGICSAYFDSRMRWLLLPSPESPAARRVCFVKQSSRLVVHFQQGGSAHMCQSSQGSKTSPLFCPKSTATSHATRVLKSLSSFVYLSGFLYTAVLQ